MQIGFIGLGIMGSLMAANILKKGFHLNIYNRSKDKALSLINSGAKYFTSAWELAANSNIVITMLSTPEIVKELSLGENGFLKKMKAGSIWIDCTTVNPSFSMELAQESKKAGVRFLDAPVAGSKVPAEKGALIFLVGGHKRDLEEVTPILQCMGSKILHAGDHGKGSIMKILVNMMLAQSMLAFAESVSLGSALGIERDYLVDTLSDLPVASPLLSLKKEKIKRADYEAEFPLEWMHKDLHLASLTAYEKKMPIPLANIAKEIYASANKNGYGRLDFSAVFKLMERD